MLHVPPPTDASDLDGVPVMERVVTPQGHTIFVDPEDARAQALIRTDGMFNEGSLRLWALALALHPYDLVMDIGANYGEMLIVDAVPTSAQLVAYEANAKLAPYLKRTFAERNRGVDIVTKAVSDGRHDTVSFVVDEEWSGTSGIAEFHPLASAGSPSLITIAATSVDHELTLRDWTGACIKVDVEGAEFSVLEGATNLIADARPWVIMVETLHMSEWQLAQLTKRFEVRMMDLRTGDLVRIPHSSPRWIRELVHGGWLYPQDALISRRMM